MLLYGILHFIFFWEFQCFLHPFFLEWHNDISLYTGVLISLSPDIILISFMICLPCFSSLTIVTAIPSHQNGDICYNLIYFWNPLIFSTKKKETVFLFTNRVKQTMNSTPDQPVFDIRTLEFSSLKVSGCTGSHSAKPSHCPVTLSSRTWNSRQSLLTEVVFGSGGAELAVCLFVCFVNIVDKYCLLYGILFIPYNSKKANSGMYFLKIFLQYFTLLLYHSFPVLLNWKHTFHSTQQFLSFPCGLAYTNHLWDDEHLIYLQHHTQITWTMYSSSLGFKTYCRRHFSFFFLAAKLQFESIVASSNSCVLSIKWLWGKYWDKKYLACFIYNWDN